MSELIVPENISVYTSFPDSTIDPTNPIMQINETVSSIFLPMKGFLELGLGPYWPLYFYTLAILGVAIKTKSLSWTAMMSVILSSFLFIFSPTESRIILTFISAISALLAIANYFTRG
ncbi:hypothetical protein [Methanococcus maripaludis]|uniref:Uncharacterized protein n=1 Tax=Methanococcus maripaludis TaxID=39152 RepID=A0A7J9PL55_METMI|nr:hypothetical protein [Methanococcus maripaludis]MBA2863993.1 hypothetical protein [Methanococcus maripaludis]